MGSESDKIKSPLQPGTMSLNNSSTNYGLTFPGLKPNVPPYEVGQGIGGAFDRINDPAMGLGGLDSIFANEKGGSSGDWKQGLAEGLSGLANAQIKDISNFRNYGMSPQETKGEEQPSWKKGYSMSEIYDQKMKQEMLRRQQEEIIRYNQGRSI
jgi:hypothetical protein